MVVGFACDLPRQARVAVGHSRRTGKSKKLPTEIAFLRSEFSLEWLAVRGRLSGRIVHTDGGFNFVGSVSRSVIGKRMVFFGNFVEAQCSVPLNAWRSDLGGCVR